MSRHAMRIAESLVGKILSRLVLVPVRAVSRRCQLSTESQTDDKTNTASVPTSFPCVIFIFISGDIPLVTT